MKKLLVLMMLFTMTVSMTACGGSSEKNDAEVQKEETSKQDTEESDVEEQEDAEVGDVEVQEDTEVSDAEIQQDTEVSNGEEETHISGINDDGIGGDPSDMTGEGIGEVIALSEEEKAYVLEQTTNSWLELSQIEKDDLVVLIGRWWEDCEDYIVEDYDDMIAVLDHQMEQYYRNSVDAGVMETACDIYGRDVSKYVAE